MVGDEHYKARAGFSSSSHSQIKSLKEQYTNASYGLLLRHALLQQTSQPVLGWEGGGSMQFFVKNDTFRKLCCVVVKLE